MIEHRLCDLNDILNSVLILNVIYIYIYIYIIFIIFIIIFIYFIYIYEKRKWTNKKGLLDIVEKNQEMLSFNVKQKKWLAFIEMDCNGLIYIENY